jgi:hypothetical protein
MTTVGLTIMVETASCSHVRTVWHRQSRGHVGRLYDVMSHTGEQLLDRFSDVNGANVDVFPTSEPPVSRDCELQMPDLHADEEGRHASRFLHLHLRAGSEQTTLCQVLFGPVDASMMLGVYWRVSSRLLVLCATW